MNEHIDPEWRDQLRRMSPEEKLAFLRAAMRLRVHCPRCLVKKPRLNVDPCYNCTILPGDLGRPTATVN